MKAINKTKARFWLRNNKVKLIIAGLLVFCLAAYYVLHQNLGYGSRASERRSVIRLRNIYNTKKSNSSSSDTNGLKINNRENVKDTKEINDRSWTTKPEGRSNFE